ncbi:MAG: MarR family winged helix-turn-helix transcriptional regulator [Bacteroidota bacterium]
MSKDKRVVTPNFDRINPASCVNARLRRLHRMINTAYQQKINPFGLRGSMLSILFIIGKNPGINQKTVADLLVLDASTMSRDLKKLMEKKWVEINKGEDSRSSVLSLSDEGYELVDEIAPVWENLHTKVQEILGSFNLQQIDIITEAIRSNMEEIKV